MLSDEFIREMKNSYKEFLNDNPSNDEISVKKIQMTNQIKTEYSKVLGEKEKEEFAPTLEKIKEIQEKFKEDSANTRKKFSDERKKKLKNLEEDEQPSEEIRREIQDISSRRDAELKTLSDKKDKDIEELNKKLENLKTDLPDLDKKILAAFLET